MRVIPGQLTPSLAVTTIAIAIANFFLPHVAREEWKGNTLHILAGRRAELIMPRPKVEPSARQRVAKACTNCKSSKQKCDGQIPCALCTRRGRVASCSFSTDAAGMVTRTGTTRNNSRSVNGSATPGREATSPLLSTKTASSNRDKLNSHNTNVLDVTLPDSPAGSLAGNEDARTSSGNASAGLSNKDTLAPVPKSIRMLRDSKGKLSTPYLGWSSESVC
jgi:uncharacterized Zn finger protein (UPF0148 family)